MRSLTLSLFFPSHTQLKQTLTESPDVAEVECMWGENTGERGAEVEYKASSGASNSKVTDLLPIR